MDHIIRFHDGSKRIISKKQAEYLMEVSGKGVNGITIGSSYIAFGSIAKILPADEYFEQYPKERPYQTTVFQPMLAEPKVDLTSNSKWLEQMIIGLKRYMSSKLYEGTEKPKELLRKWEKKLEHLKYEKQMD